MAKHWRQLKAQPQPSMTPELFIARTSDVKCAVDCEIAVSYPPEKRAERYPKPLAESSQESSRELSAAVAASCLLQLINTGLICRDDVQFAVFGVVRVGLPRRKLRQ